MSSFGARRLTCQKLYFSLVASSYMLKSTSLGNMALNSSTKASSSSWFRSRKTQYHMVLTRTADGMSRSFWVLTQQFMQ